MKASAKKQQEAINSHKKGQAALATGDLKSAFKYDDDSHVDGIAAMMLRLAGK